MSTILWLDTPPHGWKKRRFFPTLALAKKLPSKDARPAKKNARCLLAIRLSSTVSNYVKPARQFSTFSSA
jgi:hypothetical protein